jgi:MioC protein
VNKLTILFGTETGNAEMVADDVATELAANGTTARVVNMTDYGIDDLRRQDVLILIVSTYGEGELPESAVPFVELLMDSKPDLSSVRFAAFGLGDSTYVTYNNGIARVISALTDLGATQIGDTGYHDADSGLHASDVAIDWVGSIFVSTASA